MGDNLAWPGEGHRVEFERGLPRIAVRPDFQGRSGLVQAQNFEKVADGEPAEVGPYAYVDLVGHLGAWRTVTNGSSAITTPISERDGLNADAGRNGWGMQGAWPVEDIESLSDGCSGSHDASLAELQRLSLSSDHHPDHPMAKSLSPNHHVDRPAIKVKFMCSFGGKILPRPSDGKLRYVGGETRIITVNKGIGYGELMQKLTDAYGQALLLKYQLPNEDLDALVSVSSDEDFENMMEEYDRLEGSEGLSRLRVFLFSVIDYDLTHFEAMGDGRDSQQRYVDAVNSFPETGFRKHADSMKSASLQQSEKCSGPTRAQSIPDSLPSVQIPQDVTDPVHLLINVPHPSKQAIASTSMALDPSSPLLSSLPTHTEQSGVADIPVPIIPVQPLKFGNRSYSTLRLPEGCQDLGFGGCAISQQDLHRRLPELRVGDMPTKVSAIFSLPASNQDLIYSVDQQVDDPKLSKVGSSGKLANSEKQIRVTLPTLDHREDVQLLPVDPQLVVLQHPHSMHQPLRQHQLDAHQDSYSSGDYNQQARFDGGHVRQSFQQHAPLSAHLNGHEFPNNETVTFQHGDQALQSPDDVFGGPPFQKVVSVHQLGHVVPAAATLQLVGSDPSSPCFAGRQRAEVQQHVQAQRTSNASSFNPQQYETIVCHYDVQASRAFCPLTSPIGYCEIMGEQFACQNTSPQKLQSNYEDQFGCQQPMQHENVCHSSEHTMQAQETSHVYSGNFVPQHGVKSVHPTYEGTVSSQVHHSDGAVRPVLSYGGPSILQEETMPHQDNWELGGVSAPQERKREPILSEQQCYTMMPGSSGYLVQHIPKVLGSVQAEPVGSYVGMDVSENLNPFLGPELDESCRVYQKSEIFEPFVGTSYQLKQPTSAEQHRDMGILPQALQASELTRQIKDALVPSRVPSVHEVRTAHPLTEHVNSHPVIIAHSETEGRDTLIQVPAARVDSCIQQTWWGDRLDTDLAKGEGSVYLLGQRGNISEDGPKDASHIHKMLRPSDSHDTSSLDENINNLPCVPQNHPVEVAGKSLMDNTDAHSAYAWEDSLLNTSIDELKETSPNSEALAWSHDISDSDMSWVLPLEKSASTTILTCKADESSVCMQPRATDCASLSSYTSVSLDVLTERGGVGQMHATMQDSSDEYVKVELQNVAEDVAEAVLRPTLLPAPTLSVHQWDQINEDVKVEEHISQINEGAEEENVTIEDSVFEEVKTEDSDNDDHVTDAVIAEAEAIFHGLQTIKNADLEELRELGSGTFGTVYHGKWRGSDVAIKRIKNSCFSGRPSHQEHLRADFWSEARMLAQLHHPNVVAFYGVVPDGPGGTLGTVTEYMVNGSLKLVLQRKDRTIDRRKRLLIAMDAAFGMEYLHGKNIVHFDLKCENLLVNMRDPQRPICKVADFGLSKIKHQTLVSGGVRGTLPWMAPELLNGSSSMVSEKVDVYSYGIVMWELLTGEEPYANMHYGAIIGGIVSNTLRPPVPNWCDTAWRLLMEWCWSADPAARPSFTEIANELRAMRASFHPRGQVHQAPVQAHAQKQA